MRYYLECVYGDLYGVRTGWSSFYRYITDGRAGVRKLEELILLCDDELNDAISTNFTINVL
jgi:hypothetical protein